MGRCPSCPSHGPTLDPRDGTGRLGVMLVCDSLEPWSRGRFLIGRHGKTIQQQLYKLGLRMEDFSFGTAAACAPEARHLKRCAFECSQIDTLIAQRNPAVLVALDPYSFQRLTGIQTPQINARGWVYPGVGAALGRWVIPTLAPGDNPNTRGQRQVTLEVETGMWSAFRADIAKAVRIAAEGYAYETPDIFWAPSKHDWDAYVREFLLDPTRPLAVDTEFPWKRKADMSAEEKKLDVDTSTVINEFNVAYEHGRGGSVPWSDPYIEGALAMLHASQQHGTTLFWNAPADAPRLTANGGPRFTAAHTEDLMNTFRVYRNSQVRRLASAANLWPSMHFIAPWKHLGTDHPYYRGMDAIALVRGRQDMLAHFEANDGMYGYELFLKDMDPMLEHATGQGVLVDQAKVTDVSAWVDERMHDVQRQMTSAVPAELLNYQVWKTAKGAEKGLEALKVSGDVFADATLEAFDAEGETTQCGACGALGVTKAHTSRKTLASVEKGE